jgi:pSer/pThr/pTyr-binding forkhead associated (FHA) protein
MAGLRLRVDGRTTPIRLEKSPFVVGRGQRCDLTVADDLASRKHCRFERAEDDVWRVDDLGSSNGTYVNGEVIDGPTPLAESDVVGVGNAELIFTHESPSDASSSGAHAALPKHQTPHTPISAGLTPDNSPPFGAAGASFVLHFRGACGSFSRSVDQSTLTVGRGEDADVPIDDRQTSRLHCQFEVQGSSLRLVDLGSRNGTYVNGRPVNQHVLGPADVVQIGESFIEVGSRGPHSTEDMAADDSEAAARLAARHLEARGAQTLEQVDADDAGEDAPPVLGTTQPPVLMYVEEGIQKTFSVRAERTVIGRSETADLTLKEPMASREHIIIQRLANGAFELEDQESRNGTRLAGRAVRGRIQLVPGDQIEIGETVLRFELAQSDAPTMPPGPASSGSENSLPDRPTMHIARPRRPRRPRMRSTNSTATTGMVLAAVGVILVVIVLVVGSGNQQAPGGPGGAEPEPGTPGANDGPGPGTTVDGGSSRVTPPPATDGNGGADTGDGGETLFEREAREAWEKVDEQVTLALSRDQFGNAARMLRAYLNDWEGGIGAKAYTDQAAKRFENEVRRLANEEFEGFFVKQVEATPRDEREAAWGAQLRDRFGEFEEIMAKVDRLLAPTGGGGDGSGGGDG